MAGNHVLLETIQLTQSAASVTFDNIPQSGYTDLKVVISARKVESGGGTNLQMRFNGSTSGYSQRTIIGNGSSAASYSDTSEIGFMYVTDASQTANTFNSTEIYIPNAFGSNNKSISIDNVTENNSTAAAAVLTSALWANPASITSIYFQVGNGTQNFVANSTFSLYGLAAVGTTPVTAPLATGGNIVANDGTYWYHAFLSSGLFIPQTGLTCSVLQVAGGGGGGATRGGGGGAGGAFVSNTFVSTAQGVIVGAGGGGGASTAGGGGSNGTNGTNSQFGSLTAAVGGGFGCGNDGPFTSGSGGSSGGGVLWGGTPGTAVSGQGFIGGSNTVGYTVSGAAGGGGGAGAVGTSTSTSTAGAGGIGLNTWSTWHTATNTGVSGYIAGGGGGAPDGANTAGAGGAGGGGAGGAVAVGSNAVPNTGGGGGGGGRNSASGTPYAGGNGGSGLVIIRYPMA